jgi:hypothetical protein
VTTDLDAQIRDRLQGWHDLDETTAALLAVLQLHAKSEPGLFVAGDSMCSHCYGELEADEADGTWPCDTVTVIANSLGIETSAN